MANEHRDITFAIADEAEFENDLKEFGLDDSGEEISVGCFDDLNRRYKMEPDEEFSEDSLRDFVEQFKEGKPVLLVFFVVAVAVAVAYLPLFAISPRLHVLAAFPSKVSKVPGLFAKLGGRLPGKGASRRGRFQIL